MSKDSKSIGRDISGWCTFFLFQIGFCAIVLVMSFISNFELPISLNFDVDVPRRIRLIGAICMVLPTIFITGYAILIIHSFIKRKSFSVQLAMSYLLALFLNANSDLLGTLLSCNSNILNILGCIIRMIWFAIWLIYLYYSKQIEELFPISTRVPNKKGYLPIILIAIPHIIQTLIIVEY